MFVADFGDHAIDDRKQGYTHSECWSTEIWGWTHPERTYRLYSGMHICTIEIIWRQRYLMFHFVVPHENSKMTCAFGKGGGHLKLVHVCPYVSCHKALMQNRKKKLADNQDFSTEMSS